MRTTSLSFTWLALAAASLAGALLTGCGGGGGGGGGSTATGQASVSLADAPSDRLETFEVGIASVELVQEGGGLVSVAPTAARVDLAELVTLGDLVAANQVPVGTYVGVILGLDLSQARVVISGRASPARLADQAGTTLGGQGSLAALFEANRRLSITTGAQRHVELDLDLDQSIVVDDATNTVRFMPVLSAEAAPTSPRPVRLTGALASVDSSTGSFAVQLPSPAGAATPRVTVRTDGATRIVLDGQAGTLEGLAAQPAGAAVLVQGQPDTTSASYTAATVHAWTAGDSASGVVVGRTAAGALALRGATIIRASGQRETGQAVTVQAATGARITRAGATAALSLDDVAVGQRVVARGVLSGSTLDVRGAGGHLVLLDTPLVGTAVGPVASGRLTVDVARIAGRPVADFDFAIDSTVTADPARLLVDVSGLSGSTIVAGTPVSLRVQMAAWTAASAQPDASASTLVDRAATASVLRADWAAAISTPFATMGSGVVTVDLQATQHRTIDTGLASPLKLNAADRPRISPAGATGLYLIVDRGVTSPFRDFAAWQSEVTVLLQAGARVRAVTAVGRWDATAPGTLQARAVSVVME